MPKTVDIPNIGSVEFPDEMSQDQIVDAIKTRIIPQHQQKTQTVSATPQFQDLSADQVPKFAERDQGYTPTIPRSQPAQTLKQLGAEAWEEANRSLIPEGAVATTLATTAAIASPTLLRLATEKAPKATAGVFEAADDLVRGAATPLSIGMLGIAGLPAAAQRTALVGISAWMAKNAGTDAGEAVEAFRQGDTEGGTRKIVNSLANAGLSALSFAGGVRPGPPEPPGPGEKPPVLKPSEELISDATKKAPQLQASIQEAGKEPDAVQERSATKIPVEKPPEAGGEVGARVPEPEKPAIPRQKEAQGKVTPAIQTPEGRVVTGEDHVAAYEKAKATGTPDTSGSQEGFQKPTGEFISREQAAQETGVPTQTEPGKLHSSDLPTTPPPIRPGKEGVEQGQAAPLKQARDWDAFYEELVGNLDSFSPARSTGRINYELQDVAQRFVDYAKADTSGKSLTDLAKDFAKEDEASVSQIRKLKAALKDLEAAGEPAKAPAEPTKSPQEIYEQRRKNLNAFRDLLLREGKAESDYAVAQTSHEKNAILERVLRGRNASRNTKDSYRIALRRFMEAERAVEKSLATTTSKEGTAEPTTADVLTKVDTIAGKMDLTEFEKKGYSPEQVTKEDWRNLQRSERRRLGQDETNGNPNAPWSDYDEFHKQAVKDALARGEKVDPQVLADYPDLAPVEQKPPAGETPVQATAKAESVVKDTAATEGQRSAKEVKAELVARLESAIKEAPTADDVRMGGMKHVTIDIPGDGTFTIWNTKENLEMVLKRAKRIETKPFEPKPQMPRGGVKSSEKGLRKAEEDKAKGLKQTLTPTRQFGTQEPPPAKPVSVGPGAASVGEAGTYSPIQRMTDELRATAKPSDPIDTQLRTMDQAKAAVSKVGDAIQRSVANLRAIKDAIWEKYTSLPERGDEQRAVGKWYYAGQRADHEARLFGKEIIREVPSKLRREAITNWIQADGDEAVLRQRAAASKGALKLGYEQALKLTDREKQIAQMLREYFDQQLERGIKAGILQSGLENYITQVWKKENPITKKLVSDLAYGKLTPNFKYARKRIFDSYFEGEQAGYTPNKDAGFLAANYDQTFNRSLASRAFIKDLHEGKASDGRPLVELSGNGRLIGEDEGKPAVLITPHSKPEALGDYRTIDHPALRGWKYATTTPEGNTVLVKGDMLVHPEAYQKLKNRLSVSAFRQNPVSRAILQGQTTIKQTMLSVSGFHQVQETLHALGHRVNPKDMPEIDFSEPVTKALAEHGLQLADYNALESFSEGLSGGGLMTKIPVIGKTLHAYNEWLFQDYIPRLKNQMAHLALERNRERYPNLSEDKLLELSASEANAAFGELPYRYMGRSPTLQDALRTFILAPDFLEARTRFAGRAMMPYGREQLVALGLLAGTQYITARIVNQILDNDPHWEMKNAFRIVAGNHAYGLRSIPGDMAHLVTDPRSFFYYRMSPGLKTATEYITGRDARGVKRDVLEQVKDLAEMPIPISMKSKMGQQWWESFLNSFGVQEQRYDAVQNISQRVAEFKKANNITSAHESTYDPEKDKYAALRMAVENGQEKLAKKEFEKLKTTTSADAIFKHFKLSYNRPFTGSAANESKFLNSLDETGKREYEEAKALRQARLRMILSLGNQ